MRSTCFYIMIDLQSVLPQIYHAVETANTSLLRLEPSTNVKLTYVDSTFRPRNGTDYATSV